MAVDDPHPEYARRLQQVRKVRDFVKGEVSGYVRRLPGHDDGEYLLYSSQAYYLPALPRTVDSFVGMIMEPQPVLSDVPDALNDYLDDLTNDGEPLQRVAHQVAEEIVTSGRGFMLVDYPDIEASNVSRLDAESMGLRPYARFYPFEDVLNWRVASINGQKRLVHVRLIEQYEHEGEDEFDTDTAEQIRVLDIFEGRYRVRIYRQIDIEELGPSGKVIIKTVWRQHGDERFPQMNGAPLGYIPGVMFGPGSLDAGKVDSPPLYEMVGISESHLTDSANCQWALMWCGNPMIYIGDTELRRDESAEPIKVGSSELLILGTDASAGVLSLGAEGIGALRQSMEDKRRDMAAVGARILTDGGSSQISTETARLERAGEHSVLAGIANTISDGLTQVVRTLAEWAGVDASDLTVKLNTDFMPAGLQAGELTEWVNAVQAGQMPRAMFLTHLKERGAVNQTVTEQEFEDAIGEDAGSTLGFDRPLAANE